MGVFEASQLSGGEDLQPSFIGLRISTVLENRVFYPHLLPVLLCGSEMRLKELKHLPHILKKSPFDLFFFPTSGISPLLPSFLENSSSCSCLLRAVVVTFNHRNQL